MKRAGLEVFKEKKRLHEVIDEIISIPSAGTHIEIDCNSDYVPTISWSIDSCPIDSLIKKDTSE